MAEPAQADTATSTNGTTTAHAVSSLKLDKRHRMDGIPLELIVVEDSPVESVVLLNCLRRAFPDANLAVITAAHEMVEQLRRPRCDVVVTDYWLGWSDGFSVLQRAKNRWPQCRVIMLTGNGGEDLVSQALKLGLDGYLLKSDGIDALVPAIETAVATKRRIESLERDGSVIMSLPEAVFTTGLTDTITSWNPAAQGLYGYAPEEIVGRESRALVAPHLVGETVRIEARVFRGETMTQVPSVHVRKDGKRMDVSLSLAPIRGAKGAIDGVVRIARRVYR